MPAGADDFRHIGSKAGSGRAANYGRLLIAAALLVAMVQPAGAARVRMSAVIGHAGRVQPGRWVPLRVQVGGAPEGTAVEIVKSGVVERFACRTGGDHAIECPVLAEETGSVFSIRLVSGSSVLVEQALTTADKAFPGHLVLAVDVPASIQQAIGASLLPIEPVAVASVSVSDLPRHGLSYDSVSGLVIADPGPVLSPAQAQVMRSWLAGGGCLVLLRAKAWQASIVSHLLAAPVPESGAQIGLGRIVRAGSEMEKPGIARELLGLSPYERTRRLTASRCAGNSVRISPPRKTDALLPFLAGWAAVSLMAGLAAGRKKTLTWLILATLAGTAAAVPAGLYLDRAWRRGAVMEARAVILPGTGSALVFTELYPGPGTAWTPGTVPSPWTIAVGASTGEESGLLRIAEGEDFVWRHEMPLPIHAAVRRGQSIVLTAFIPVPSVDPAAYMRAAGTNRTGILEGGRWRQPADNGGNIEWHEIEGEPEWLAGGSPWVRELAGLMPDLPWLVGIGPIVDTRLTLQGVAEHDSLWAVPLLEEIR